MALELALAGDVQLVRGRVDAAQRRLRVDLGAEGEVLGRRAATTRQSAGWPGGGAERVVVVVEAAGEVQHLAEGELDLLLAVGRHREDADAEDVGVDVLEQARVLQPPDDALVDVGGLLLLEHLALGLLAVDPEVELGQRGALGEREDVVGLELRGAVVLEDLFDAGDGGAVLDLHAHPLALDGQGAGVRRGGQEHALSRSEQGHEEGGEQQQASWGVHGGSLSSGSRGLLQRTSFRLGLPTSGAVLRDTLGMASSECWEVARCEWTA